MKDDVLRKRYLEQVARLYGKRCADASICMPSEEGFFINLAIEGAAGFEVRGNAAVHSRKEVESMIKALSTRTSNGVQRRMSRKGATYD